MRGEDIEYEDIKRGSQLREEDIGILKKENIERKRH